MSDPHFSSHVIWVLICAQVVMFMTLPGLALFYGGLVQKKNVLSIVGQCFVIAAIMIILWVVVGYSLSFGDGGVLNPYIGGVQEFFVGKIDLYGSSISSSILARLLFQLGFSVITPALIVGGFAERMRFSSFILFIILWEIVVYYPICHWTWGGGWLQELGFLDFAGGAVVHINAGVAGLVAALVLGRRQKKSKEEIEPHNITLVAIGTGILWFGWVGFNAGSASSGHRAIIAVLVTHLAAASAALTWLFFDWLRYRKYSVLALFFGAITGLVAITPASGYVGPIGAIIIGVVASICCAVVSRLKHRYGYDDALDAFGVHGFGGIVGSLLTAVFVGPYFGGIGFAAGMDTLQQLGVQALGVLATVIWSGVFTYLILSLLVKIGMHLRVSREEEESGIDIISHGETAYRL